jgi:hypothetical protein
MSGSSFFANDPRVCLVWIKDSAARHGVRRSLPPIVRPTGSDNPYRHPFLQSSQSARSRVADIRDVKRFPSSSRASGRAKSSEACAHALGVGDWNRPPQWRRSPIATRCGTRGEPSIDLSDTAQVDLAAAGPWSGRIASRETLAHGT